MTSAPVPLAEQPTAEEIGLSIAGLIGVRLNYEAQGAPPEALKLIDLARKVCCDYASIKQSLQQHERAMAALREPDADFVDRVARASCFSPPVGSVCKCKDPSECWNVDDLVRLETRTTIRVVHDMLAALDATNPAGDAVTTEKDKQIHGDEDRC